MKKLFVLSLFMAFVVTITSCKKEESPSVKSESSPLVQDLVGIQNGDIIPGKYIIILDEQPVKSQQNYETAQKEVRALAEDILSQSGLKSQSISTCYSHSIKGFAAELSKEQAALIAKDERVIYVEQDQYVILKKPDNPGGGGGGGGTTSQNTPYGIARVGGGATYTGDNVVWILDTGIDLDHPDLNVDVSRSVAFGQNTPDDGHGHGTHCAGTIAAIDNDFGVVGVAAGATVIAVRILDRRGYGATSDCIAGVDYVGANGVAGDVANMSVGYPASTALDQAVVNAASNGIYFALAAGNDGLPTYNSPQPSPGRVNGNNIWTVSAMDSNDDFAYFSNYGNPPVDLCGPGVSVYSCYKRGGYATMSGTSMATPHVCGVLLMTNGSPGTDGTVNGDPDGNADDIVHL